jgi:uncharacterized membrane protein YphA (DoxX/SURF4 family)
MKAVLNKLYELLELTIKVVFFAPLALRLYLVPIFWMAGTKIWGSFDSTVEWFGNSDWGLGLPFPLVLAFLATWVEILGAISLLLGIGLRWIAGPLIFTMIIAMTSVHAENGWQAIADPGGSFSNERVTESAEKLSAAKSILKENGNYSWLTSSGSIVVLNNGIEFAATYLIMLLSLLFTGAGRFVSFDYWFKRRYIDQR